MERHLGLSSTTQKVGNLTPSIYRVTPFITGDGSQTPSSSYPSTQLPSQNDYNKKHNAFYQAANEDLFTGTGCCFQNLRCGKRDRPAQGNAQITRTSLHALQNHDYESEDKK